MPYIDGFVAAVPVKNKDAYRKHVQDAEPLFKEFGATRMVETWGDDVPDGKVTDFKGAVQAKQDEAVVFSWVEYPDRATRDEAQKKMMSDERMKQMGAAMPFDGHRLIYGGFAPLVDQGSGKGGYVDGFIVPVPAGKKDAYRALATNAAAVFKEHGAIRVVEAWGDDVPEGKTTDFYRAIKATKGENVVFSWIIWPDKATRQKAWQQVMDDPRMKKPEGGAPFDEQRMFWGGFEPIFDA
jgi:uncharacterized protein YbaA (DUF1428 family)